MEHGLSNYRRVLFIEEQDGTAVLRLLHPVKYQDRLFREVPVKREGFYSPRLRERGLIRERNGESEIRTDLLRALIEREYNRVDGAIIQDILNEGEEPE